MPRIPEELKEETPTMLGLGEGDVLVEQYEVRERLGRGGMGEVYRGRDLHLDRDVAVKVLPAFLGSSERARRSLREEARRAIALTHPALGRIHHFGIHQDQPFVVMEYVAGDTLAERLDRGGPLDLDAALAILAPLAEGLDHAHAQGVVHRDLKPANILLREETGAPVLIDFGIAAEVRDQTTRTGQGAAGTAGTLSYMSPEQIRGAPPAPAMDRYALAAVAYEMLAGQPPFFRGDPMNVQYQIVHEAPPAVPGLEDSPMAVLRKGLAKDPEERYATAADLVGALRAGDAPPPPAEGPGATLAYSRSDLRVEDLRPPPAPPAEGAGGDALPGGAAGFSRWQAAAIAAVGALDGVVTTAVLALVWNFLVVEQLVLGGEGVPRMLAMLDAREWSMVQGAVERGALAELIVLLLHGAPLVFLFAPAFMNASGLFAGFLEERIPGAATPLLAGIPAGIFPGAVAVAVTLLPGGASNAPGPARLGLFTAGLVATGEAALISTLFLPKPRPGTHRPAWGLTRAALVLVFPVYSFMTALVIGEFMSGEGRLAALLGHLVGAWGPAAWVVPTFLVGMPLAALVARISAKALEKRAPGTGGPVILGLVLAVAVHGVTALAFRWTTLGEAFYAWAACACFLGAAGVLAAGWEFVRGPRVAPPGTARTW